MMVLADLLVTAKNRKHLQALDQWHLEGGISLDVPP